MSLDLQAPPTVEVPLPPQAASTTSKTRRPWLVVVLSGPLWPARSHSPWFRPTTLSGVNEDLTASQGTVSNLRDDVSGLEGDLALAEGAVDSLESQVSDQDAQLASCYQANCLSVQADKAFHAAVAQIVPAAFGGSDYRFDAALAKYQDKAGQWADAANACEGGGNTYSFG